MFTNQISALAALAVLLTACATHQPSSPARAAAPPAFVQPILPALPIATPARPNESGKPWDGLHKTTTETLFKTASGWDAHPWSGYPAGRAEISIVRVIIPPHQQLAAHVTTVPSVALVKSGQITVVRIADGLKKTYKENEFLPEMVNTAQYGFTEDEGVELLIFRAGTHGKPGVVMVR